MSSAATERERRKTAGRRMNALVGQAQDDDDAFWGHDTWNEEDGDSGNDSFRESDEDSSLAKDQFDSDFDDSETDNEQDEEAAGQAEELELQMSERASKQQRRGASYVDKVVSTARGKKGSGKRIMGEGFNAGIVLRFPPQMYDSLSMLQERQKQQQTQQQQSSTLPHSQLTQATPSTENSSNTKSSPIAPHPLSPKKYLRNDPVLLKSTLVSTRERRSTHGSRKLRETRSTPGEKSTSSSSIRKSASQQSSKSTKRKRYPQEELLMEAVHETEPENQRWLYARKRVQDQNDKDANSSALRDRQRGKVIQKFHSRRGCLTTLTFPEMDSVPEILTRRSIQKQAQQQQQIRTTHEGHEEHSSDHHLSQSNSVSVLCAVTGRPAKYKDPVTKQPYFDSAAFKELRKRHTTAGLASFETRPLSINHWSVSTDATEEEPLLDKRQMDGKGERGETQRDGKIAGTRKKSATSNSKLPFQSPKPPKASGVKTNDTSSNDIINGKPDPTLAHLAFSWSNGQDDSSNRSPVSPSGRRLSRRKWKPSEKILQTIAMSPKKDGIIATPPGIKMKPQELGEGIPSIPPPPLPIISTEELQAEKHSNSATSTQKSSCASTGENGNEKLTDQGRIGQIACASATNSVVSSAVTSEPAENTSNLSNGALATVPTKNQDGKAVPNSSPTKSSS